MHHSTSSFLFLSVLPSKAKSKRFCTGHGENPRCQLKCLQALTASQTIRWPSLHSRATQRGSSLWSGLAFRTGTVRGSASCRWDSRSRSDLKLTFLLLVGRRNYVSSLQKVECTPWAKRLRWAVSCSLIMHTPLAINSQSRSRCIYLHTVSRTN